MSRSARIFANALTRSSEGRVNGMPGASLSGSRLTLRLDAGEERCEPARVLGRVVDAVEQHVLERDAAALREREAPAGVDQIAQRVLAIDRHDLAALLLSRRVKRDREVRHQRLGRQPFDARYETNRRQRHAPRMHREPLLIGDHSQCFHRRVVVVEWLTHAHQDDVEGRTGEAGGVREHADLTDDLAGGKIPHEPHLAGQAERAAHRAPDLRRDAERLRGRVGNVDRFDVAAVGELQQKLRRAVFRGLAGFERGRRNSERLSELHPQLLAEVRHLREVGHAARVNPAKACRR